MSIFDPEFRDYKLTLHVVPVIPSLRGQHFAAKPVSLVCVADKAPIPTGGLRESYGVTEQDAARACVQTVEQFLEARSKATQANSTSRYASGIADHRES